MSEPSNVVAGPSANVLSAITNQRVGLTLWWRALCPHAMEAAAEVLEGPAFAHATVGEPRQAVADLLDAVPSPMAALGPDIERLAGLFAKLSRSSLVRVRLEHARKQTCPLLHVDVVRLRMLCTYAGPGTEWQDGTGTVRRIPTGHVALLKGTRWLGQDRDTLVPHRSPASDGAPESARLLLRIDQPDLH